jgi:aminoglycoside phosphotransferase
VQFPAQIARYVAGWPARQVWDSGEARTWRLTGPDGRELYLKTAPAQAAVPLRAEAARARWALAAGLPVPRILAACGDGSAEWLLSEGLPGTMAADARLRADPQRLVPILARGLRRFHATPVAGCPFPFSAADALARIRRRVSEGRIRPADMHDEHRHLSPAAALAELERLRPGREDLVVCHGDYCLPNVLIEDGAAVGFVDLGELGVADRWRDLAVGSWSVTWNLGPGWEDLFLASYGAERDERRMAFYRLLYDVTS